MKKRHFQTSLPCPTPCRALCKLNASNQCEGCGRTMHEIANWREMSNDERWSVYVRLQLADIPSKPLM